MNCFRTLIPTLLLSFGLSVGAVTASAITIDDLTGVYVGKRTESSDAFTVRYDEVTIVDPDGLVTNYVFVEGLPGGVFISQGYLELNEDGTFYSGETGVGHLELHGRFLDVSVHFETNDGFPSWPETTVHSRLHRTDRPIESLTPWLH